MNRIEACLRWYKGISVAVLWVSALLLFITIIVHWISLLSDYFLVICPGLPYDISFICVFFFTHISVIISYTIAENDEDLDVHKIRKKILIFVLAAILTYQLFYFTWAYTQKDKRNDEDFLKSLYNLMNQKKNNKLFWQFLHEFEKQNECCGYGGYEDYTNSSIPRIPGTCCGRELYKTCAKDEAFSGCANTIKTVSWDLFLISAHVGYILTIIEMVTTMVIVLPGMGRPSMTRLGLLHLEQAGC